MWKFLLERLSEPSTWKGIVVLLGTIGSVFGYQFSPELSGQILALGLAIAGLINVFTKEAKEREVADVVKAIEESSNARTAVTERLRKQAGTTDQ